jgi:hypothetical protein
MCVRNSPCRSLLFPRQRCQKISLMWHDVDVISLSSWEPQEEGMMSTVANFPSVRNQGLSVQEKAKLQKVMLASLVTLQKGHH